MDRLSEWKNQWVEQYMRLVTGGQPKDWSDWLAIATAVHNNWKNSTTGLSPNQILLGIEPMLHPSEHHITNNEAMERRVERMEEAQGQATRAINKKAAVTPSAQYKHRDQVWLEVTHLKLPHQGSKLNPKQYGPFKILNVISPIAFKLDLPISWTIHPVFHLSSYPLYWNICPQTKLLLAPTWPNWWQRTIQSGTNQKPPTTRLHDRLLDPWWVMGMGYGGYGYRSQSQWPVTHQQLLTFSMWLLNVTLMWKPCSSAEHGTCHMISLIISNVTLMWIPCGLASALSTW